MIKWLDSETSSISLYLVYYLLAGYFISKYYARIAVSLIIVSIGTGNQILPFTICVMIL